MKNLTILTMILAMFYFASGCEKDEITTTTDFKLNESFEVKYNELAQLNTNDLQILVDEVIEDSRCPENAFCTWAGQITLNLEIIQNGTKIYEEIDFSSGNSTEISIENYLIQLTKVIPENEIDEVIELDDYTFTFLITEQ